MCYINLLQKVEIYTSHSQLSLSHLAANLLLTVVRFGYNHSTAY